MCCTGFNVAPIRCIELSKRFFDQRQADDKFRSLRSGTYITWTLPFIVESHEHDCPHVPEIPLLEPGEMPGNHNQNDGISLGFSGFLMFFGSNKPPRYLWDAWTEPIRRNQEPGACSWSCHEPWQPWRYFSPSGRRWVVVEGYVTRVLGWIAGAFKLISMRWSFPQSCCIEIGKHMEMVVGVFGLLFLVTSCLILGLEKFKSSHRGAVRPQKPSNHWLRWRCCEGMKRLAHSDT